jgi:hypothetical protein
MSMKEQVPAIDLAKDPMVGIFHEIEGPHTNPKLREKKNKGKLPSSLVI